MRKINQENIKEELRDNFLEELVPNEGDKKREHRNNTLEQLLSEDSSNEENSSENGEI